jgi:RimK-like ATP-grasp domain
VAAYRFEKSKALQCDLFERLGLPYPRTRIVNHADEVPAAARHLRFPVLVKPNVGGSGAGIVRFDSPAELEAKAASLDLGPDHTALVQEYLEPAQGAIVRVEVLDGRVLYAIRIVRENPGHFNLCPADLCHPPSRGERTAPPPPTDVTSLSACPVTAPTLAVTRCEPAREAADAAIQLARAASIDVGGVEYLVGKSDSRIYVYDVNATSNFVANAPEVLGFDPFPVFVDSIVRRAAHGRRAPVAWPGQVGTGRPTAQAGALLR